jgi:hypothetical protein
VARQRRSMTAECVASPRLTFTSTRLLSLPRAELTSSVLRTCSPLIDCRWSPGWRPSSSASEPGRTLRTCRPLAPGSTSTPRRGLPSGNSCPRRRAAGALLAELAQLVVAGELADGGLEVQRAAFADDPQRGLGAGLELGDAAAEVAEGGDVVAVDADDAVAVLQSGLGGGGAGHDGADDGAGLGGAADGGFDVAAGDAEPAADDLAGALDLRDDLLGLVDGDGEAEALAAGVDGGVDGDDLALEVEQRAAARAGGDRGVGLQEVDVAVGVEAEAAAALGRDDAGAGGLLEAHGASRWR